MTTRRDILRSMSAFGSAGLASAALPGFAAMAQQAGSSGGYKALVCVFLAGGMDGHDTVIPRDAESYAEWAEVRSSLLGLYARTGNKGREREQLAPLGSQGDGREFGMPPEMRRLADLYREGRMAVVANVGPLVVPTTGAEARAQRVPLPPKLMSHNDQQSVWQALGPEGATLGWGGRMIDVLGAAPSPYAAVSAAGNPVFLAGRGATPLVIGTGEIEEVVYNSATWSHGSPDVPEALREHFSASASAMNNLLASDFQNAQRESVRTINELAGVASGVTAGQGIGIEGNKLSEQLAAVARMISLRGQLGVSRQVFFVKMGGFDTHQDQQRDLPGLQRGLAEALAAFYRWTESAGLGTAVTTFTASDFGRTLTTNANGTDHGWGNHHLVLGGAVRGGRIVGQLPPTVVDHAQDFGRGRLVPGLATSQYAASLGRWFGLSDGQLADVLPGLGRFDSRAVTLF